MNNEHIDEFVADLDYKRDFIRWLENNFMYFKGQKDNTSLEQISKNLDKIYHGVQFLQSVTETKSCDALRRYYAHDWINIREAYNQKDAKAFASAINDLKTGVKWE